MLLNFLNCLRIIPKIDLAFFADASVLHTVLVVLHLLLQRHQGPSPDCFPGVLQIYHVQLWNTVSTAFHFMKHRFPLYKARFLGSRVM